MRPTATVAVLVVFGLLLAACSQANRPGADRSESVQESAPAAAPVAAPGPANRGVAAQAGAPAAVAPQSAQQTQLDTTQRLIVRTANLTLVASDVADSAGQIRALAETVGGFVVTSTQREESGRPTATVTIRVPAQRFDETMERLRGFAVRVSNEQVSARDVTEEFVDTDARLRNLKATEERYLALLQQARTVEDILKIEQQLSNVRGQIEQLQGRLQFLQRSAETSLITVELRPYAASQTALGDWAFLPVVLAAWNALLNTLQLLVSAVIWLAIFAPIWIPLILLLRRWLRRRRGARPAPPAPLAPATPPARP